MRALAGALVVVCAGLLYAVCTPTARADEWNHKTIVTINEPIEVPGRVLEPGKYVFQLMNSQDDRNIVQIWSAHRMHLLDTVLAVPAYRYHVTGRTIFRLDERPSGTPEAIGEWFYPGEHYGDQFVYNYKWPVRTASNYESNPTMQSGGK